MSSAQTQIYIANRDKPTTNASGFLTIDRTGRFFINPSVGDPVDLYLGNLTSNIERSATLQDNGNLVLQEVNSNGSAGRILWESFDYPADTLLPGMKLGVNHRTGRNWSLTSWLAEDNPSPGPFTLEWNPKELQLVLSRRGESFWTSGALKDQTFEHMVDYNFLIESYNMTYTKNSDEEFFNYSLIKNPTDGLLHKSIKWRIMYDGTLTFEKDMPVLALQNKCYGYNTDGGCAEWRQPQCRNMNDKPIFDLLSGYFIPPDAVKDFDFNESFGPDDCRIKCWNDCDCRAYLDITSCILWKGKGLKFQLDPSGHTVSKYVIQNGKFLYLVSL